MRFLIVIACFISSVFAQTETPAQRVGQTLLLKEIYIPGGEAIPAPRRDRQPPVIVRLTDIKSAKDGFRYDFEIQGLDPGTYDLAKFLVASDESAPPKFPTIPFTITSALPKEITLPHPILPQPSPALGGYKKTMLVLAGIWIAGLAAILYWRKNKPDIPAEIISPPSVAERIRPLLDQASNGNLDTAGRASLERLILGHWRGKFPEISAASPSEALAKLREIPQAAPLLIALERWLHARDSKTSPAEIEAMLAPYR